MKLTRFLLIICLPLSLFAQDNDKIDYRWGVQTAYYFPNQSGYESSNGWAPIDYGTTEIPEDFSPLGSDDGRSLGNGWGAAELQFWIDRTQTLPLLQGDSPLTSGNNLQINTKADLSPATADVNLSFKLTPIAFLVFEQGHHLGTGWYAGIANGLGLNADGSGDPETDSFPGVVYKGWFSGTFQFDLAEALPEATEWHHVVLSSTARFEYQAFSGANKDEPWQYQADEGENFNGWLFKSSHVLGYMIPRDKINFAGIMLETERRLGDISRSSTISSGGWGSDFTEIDAGPLLNWQIDDESSLVFLLQWKNAVQYDDDSVFYNYFMNRESTGDSYWYFNRIALSYTKKF
ncbi:MAG: hypothetical protein PQJ59_02745 [Spirochaetales bacterium]|nr:hypothetical protein [Spirochaetales bacterium]